MDRISTLTVHVWGLTAEAENSARAAFLCVGHRRWVGRAVSSESSEAVNVCDHKAAAHTAEAYRPYRLHVQ